MRFDVVVVGAGPVGLAFAASLRGTGLRLALVDRQPDAQLAAPPYDGRETAVTHLSARILQASGAWDLLPAAEISPLREAHVGNGDSPYLLRFDAGAAPGSDAMLGRLVPFHRIRAALFAVAAGLPEVTLFSEATITGVDNGLAGGTVRLADGTALHGRLLVAADSRLSETRARFGIEADLHRTGSSMLVCRLQHEHEHGHVATERFEDRQIIALLPLNGRRVSLVLTLPDEEIAAAASMPLEAFEQDITRRTRQRLGRMRLAGSRHTYPLATCYARRFVGPGCALLGDAAVGMNPMTAHGFNLGLRGQDTLAGEIRTALARGIDFAGPGVLARFERKHRAATFPLFAGTNLLARLYTDRSGPGRLARHAALRLANNLPPFRSAVRSMLIENERPAA